MNTPMRRPDASKSELDALDHHVADHLAGDARRCRQPADHLAIVTVEELRAKATRTISPFQQVNSSASKHQRIFELPHPFCQLAGLVTATICWRSTSWFPGSSESSWRRALLRRWPTACR